MAGGAKAQNASDPQPRLNPSDSLKICLEPMKWNRYLESAFLISQLDYFLIPLNSKEPNKAYSLELLELLVL